MTYGKYFEKTMNKFLIGYSLGSVLAFNTAVNKKDFFDGVVMIAPPIILEVNESSFKFKLLSLLNKVFPGFPLLPLKSKFFLLKMKIKIKAIFPRALKSLRNTSKTRLYIKGKQKFPLLLRS